MSDNKVFSLVLDPANPLTIYAGIYGGGVFKSVNGGATWSAVNFGLSNHFVRTLAIDPTNPLLLYAGTEDGVFKTQLTPSLSLTTTSISLPSTIYGDNASVTVTVSSASVTPSGNVTLSLNGGAVMTQTLSPVSGSNPPAAAAVFTFAKPADGNYILKADYAAQNQFVASSITSPWLVDLTSPDTSITSQPANPSNSAAASFSFIASEANSTFECKLDSTAFAACSSPMPYSELVDGNHTFQVRAIDSSGNVDATPASYSWIINLPINGTCGSSSGGTFATVPQSGLCSTGRASAVIGSNSLTWTCFGINGGTYTDCSATVDTTAPIITAFAIPTTSTSSFVPITAFTKSDSVNVTGYLITESPDMPSVMASGWRSVAPSSYTFSDITPGTLISRTLYAWAKDANGNISVSRNASVTILIPAFASNYTSYGGLQAPHAVAVDKNGKLYIADSQANVIRKATPTSATTGVITTLAGNGASGYSGDAAAATSAKLNYPTGVVLDAGGNLYIADRWNHVVRKVAAGTGIITTIAGIGNSFGYSGDGGPATSAQLMMPTSVKVDAGGNIYIADSGNNAIRKVDAATGIITTIAGIGASGYGGDGGPAILAALNSPTDIALDHDGTLYIADNNNNVIRRVAAETGVISTLAGTG